MKLLSSIRTLKFALLLAVCAVLASQTGRAQFVYNVSIDTSALAGIGNAPYAVDFTMLYGGGGPSNYAGISNFSFGGGSAGDASRYLPRVG